MGRLHRPLKVALIQLAVTANKTANIANATGKIRQAAEQGAELVVLPEIWNSPYAVQAFTEYAEPIPDGPTTRALAEAAAANKIWLIGGSIPERSDGKLYNTSLTFTPEGKQVAKHRKIHLFDIDVPGKIRFVESETLSPGSSETVVDLPSYGTIGVGICYDIRFPELAMRAVRKSGAFAMVYPGAFNLVTGPLHWELLARARAVDNQCYALLCSPARDMADGAYHAYGHSMVVDPWGKIVAEAGEGEEIVYATLEPESIDSVVSSIPISSQRRFDIYPDVAK